MKKSLLLILVSITISILLIIFQNTIKKVLTETTLTFIYNYIPCILPFSLLISLTLKFINFLDLYIFLKNRKMCFVFDLFIIILIMISGTPGNITILKQLSKDQIYTKEKVDSLLINYGTISLPFIYSITNKNSLFLYLIISVNSISYLLTKNSLSNSYISNQQKTYSIKQSITNSFITIYFFLIICVLISLPINLIFNSKFLIFILGFFETTFPAISLVKLNHYYFTYFLLASSSFSLIYQLYQSYKLFPIYRYIKKRLILASLITILMFICS